MHFLTSASAGPGDDTGDAHVVVGRWFIVEVKRPLRHARCASPPVTSSGRLIDQLERSGSIRVVFRDGVRDI